MNRVANGMFIWLGVVLVGIAIGGASGLELFIGVVFCPRDRDERTLRSQLTQFTRNVAIATEAIADANSMVLNGTNVTFRITTSNATDDLRCLELVRQQTRSEVLIAAFGRAISEVGAVMIVGGNIDGFTRVMTTAIALETSKGDLPLALALGLILLGLVLVLNALIAVVRRWREEAQGSTPLLTGSLSA